MKLLPKQKPLSKEQKELIRLLAQAAARQFVEKEDAPSSPTNPTMGPRNH
jgi:hypothetical protein